jgi:hypothetical protein
MPLSWRARGLSRIRLSPSKADKKPGSDDEEMKKKASQQLATPAQAKASTTA